MWWNFPNIIEFETEKEYLDLFISEYIEKDFKTHDWIKIKLQVWNFYHIFYRWKWTDNVFFDKWLARRILWLRTMIENKKWNIEIYEQFNNKKNRKERNYIYVYWKICVFLWEDKNRDFYIITAYRKTIKKLEVIRKSPNVKKMQ